MDSKDGNKKKMLTKVRTFEVEVDNVEDDDTKQSSFAPSTGSNFKFKPLFFKPNK